MEKIIIFGASLGGERALKSLSRGKKAIAFSDNDPKKHGSTLSGLPVVAPNEILQRPYDKVLIASSYYPEIFNQLVDLGVPLRAIDILDADILNGVEETSPTIFWILGGAGVVVALALYGLYRLIFG